MRIHNNYYSLSFLSYEKYTISIIVEAVTATYTGEKK